jgi:hypothetical protein
LSVMDVGISLKRPAAFVCRIKALISRLILGEPDSPFSKEFQWLGYFMGGSSRRAWCRLHA